MFREQISQWGEAKFRAPASAESIAACESALGHPIPDELRALYSESDGVFGDYELGLIWDVERVGSDNLWMRGDQHHGGSCMPFDGLVFFADAGNGDYFGLRTSGRHEVLVWNHEDDSRMWVAETVISYLEKWMTGVLKI